MNRIIYTQSNGVAAIFCPADDHDLATLTEAVAPVEEIFDVPTGVFEVDGDGRDFEVMGARTHNPEPVIVDASTLPTNKTFRNAWRKSGATVATDIPAAKLLAHGMRRRARDLEMKPLDVQATIPSQATAAESARQVIRDKYAIAQTDIDAAVVEADLLGIVQGFPAEE